MMTTGISDYKKASKLILVIQLFLKGHSDPEQYLVKVCHVLQNQEQRTIKEIAELMLKKLGNFTTSVQF